MAQADSDQTAEQSAVQPILIKKYANRRLYNTETSSYITLENLADMVRQGRDFYVQDARSGEDLTRSVLTQIIVEEENKVGRAMLPIPFLRQLIGFYGDSLQGVVPRYLEESMAMFSRQQQEMRAAVQQTMGTMGSLMPPGFEEMGRRNMAMLDRAMTLFTPFLPKTGAPSDAAAQATQPAAEDDQAELVASLKQEISRLRAELAAAMRPATPEAKPAAAPVAAPARKAK